MNFLKGFHIKRNNKEGEIPLGSIKTKEKELLFDLFIHDLNEPLSIAATSANNLAQREDRYGPLADSQKRILNRILRNVQRAQNLLHEMIEILRSEEGLFKGDFFSVEKTLNESLLAVLEMSVPNAVEELYQIEDLEAFRGGLKKHGIFIEITGKYGKAPFYHDQKKIQQIFRNLMSNAMKYRRKRMEVKISGEEDLNISVEDDGIGIPLKDQGVVFERFVRLNNEKRPYIQGLGLGLAGVKTLVGAMSGEITLESQEGVGTRFMVRIPPIPTSISKK